MGIAKAKLSKMKKSMLILGCLAVLMFSCENNFWDLQVERLSDRVALIYGGLNDTNVLAIAAKEGMIMIDAPFTKGITDFYKAAATKEFNRDDFIYLINSHADICHIGGNSAFMNEKVIAHENTALRIHQSIIDTTDNFNIRRRPADIKLALNYYNSVLDTIPEGNPKPERIVRNKKYVEFMYNELSTDIKNNVMKMPDITFNDALTLNLDDLTLDMVYYGYSHTNTHIIIYIPEEGILFTGGIINKELIPISEIDESAPPDLVENWLEILSLFTSDTVNLKYLIPSHGGKEAMYDAELLSRYAEYLDTLWKQVCQMKSQNLSLETIKDRLNFETHFEEYHDLDNSVGVGTWWGIENIHEQNIDGFWLLNNKR